MTSVTTMHADILPFPTVITPVPTHRTPRTSRANHAPVPEALQLLHLRVMGSLGRPGTVLGSTNHARIIEVQYDDPQDDCWGLPGSSHGSPVVSLMLYDDEHRICYGDPWDVRLAVAAVTWCEVHGCAEIDCPQDPDVAPALEVRPMPTPDVPAGLLTVGHGKLSHEELVALLRGAGVTHLVDVRSHPGSKHNPDATGETLKRRLPEDGITYTWEPRLGGRRRPVADGPDVVWRHPSFRAYASHARSVEFVAAMDELLELAARTRVAVMCSESVWWRCHRRFIADFATVARRREVLHLMHDGKLRPHTPMPGVRLRPDGLLVYDIVPDEPTPTTDAPAGPAEWGGTRTNPTRLHRFTPDRHALCSRRIRPGVITGPGALNTRTHYANRDGYTFCPRCVAKTQPTLTTVA